MKLLHYMAIRPLLRAMRDEATVEGKQSCTFALCIHDEKGQPVLVGLQIKRKKIADREGRHHAINSLILRLCGEGGSSHRDEKKKWNDDGVLSRLQAGEITAKGLNNTDYLGTHSIHIERGLFGELDVLAKITFPLSFDSLPYGRENWRIKYID